MTSSKFLKMFLYCKKCSNINIRNKNILFLKKCSYIQPCDKEFRSEESFNKINFSFKLKCLTK